MTARTFPGSAGINCDAGAVNATGAFTWVSLYNTTTAASVQYVFTVGTAGGYSAIRLNSSGVITYALNSTGWSSATDVTYTGTDGWVLVAITKPAGTSNFRIHKYRFSNSTWTRQSSTTGQASPAAATSVRHGHANSSSYFTGDIAASAAYDYEMTDSQVTALLDSFDAWMDAGPDGMWVFDQASTATAVDDETGNGADQTSTVGSTSVSSATPPIAWAETGGGGNETIGFRTGTGASATGTASSAALTIPAGVMAGDRMIISVAYKLLTGTGTIQTPAGWAVVPNAGPVNGPSGNTMQGAVFSKVAAGTAGNVSTDAGTTLTVTGTGGSQQLNVSFGAYAGVDSIRSSSWTVGSTTASTSVICPAPATGAQAGDLVVLVGAVRGATSGPANAPTFTAPAGAAIRAQSANVSGSAQNMACFVGDHNDSNASRTVTASGTSWSIAGQVVLVPAATTTAVDRATSESITLADAVATGPTARPRGTAETVTLADALARAAMARSRATSEALTLADAVAGATARARAAGEAMTLGDAVAVSVSRGRAIAQSLTLADATSRNVARVAAIAEALGLVDAAAITPDQVRSSSGTLTVVDSMSSTRAMTRTPAESVTLTDVPTRTVTRARAAAESVTLADTFGRTVAQARAAAESVTLSDSFARGQGVALGVAEQVTLSDAWGYTSARSLTGSAALSLTDAASRQVASTAAVAESLTLAELVTTGRLLTIGVAEAIGLADAFDRAVAAARGGNAAVSFDVTAVPGVAYGRGVDESLTLVDETAAGRVVLVGVDEAITFTADVTRAATAYGRGVGEALALTNTVARQVARSREFGQALTLTDVWQFVRFALTGWSETVTLDAAATRAATSTSRSWSDPLVFGNAISRQVGRARTGAEQISLADTEWLVSRSIVPVAAAVEISFGDNMAGRVSRARSFVQPIGFNDTFSRKINRARGLAEAIVLGHLMSMSRGQMISASVGLTLDDRTTRAVTRARGTVEQLTLAAGFGLGFTPTEQPAVAYPHFVTMTSSPWRIHDTTVRSSVRRTV